MKRPFLLGVALLACACRPDDGERQGMGLGPGMAWAAAPQRERSRPTPKVTGPRLAASVKVDAAKGTETSSPVALTATDGTGLRLLTYRARAVLQGPLALTELELTFRNPRPEVIEGRFSITLPGGATISRFAMRLGDGRWQEAEVVPRQKARRAYEDFLHRRQDPALLERDAANRFRARIFPIPAGGRKQIKISYSQELVSSETPYRLKLAGLPRVGLLSATVWRGAGQKPLRFARRDYQPTRDLVVHGSAAVAGLRHGNLVVARVKPRVTARAQAIGSLLLLIDSSASRALGFAAQLEKVAAVLDELRQTAGAAVRVQVACFDQRVAPIFEGTLGQLSEVHLKRILARGALGASNLERALRWAARRDYRRIVVVTDAVATAGTTTAAAVRRALDRAKARRLDVILSGGIRDRQAAVRLARENGLAAVGTVLDGDQPAQLLARRLGHATLSRIGVSVAGARWVWPERLDGVQPGDEVLIYADLEPGALRAREALRVSFSGGLDGTRSVRLVGVQRPLLERAWVRARIARLTELLQAGGLASDQRATYLRQIVGLSTRYRVLSDHTALLVLETEADYLRFGIDRRALADILVVTPRGPRLLQRKDAVTSRPASVRAPTAAEPGEAQPDWLSRRRRGDRDQAAPEMRIPRRRARVGGELFGLRGPRGSAGVDAEQALGGLIGKQIGSAHGAGGLGMIGTGHGRGGGGTGEGTIGLGSLGTIGRGGGGQGAGYGRLRGRRAGRRPRVMTGRPTVRGALDREIIRRIIRRHINEVRYCYARGLQSRPALAGRVNLQFSIASNGRVVSSTVISSTLGDRRVGVCISAAVRRWRFPAPRGGGLVIVRYPFVLRASGGTAAVRAPRRSRRTVLRPAAPPPAPPSYSGRMKPVMALLARGATDAAFAAAVRWRREHPGNVLALVALGETLGALGRLGRAARAYGSIIDLYPSRADMRRFAGARLESLGRRGAPALAADTYRVAAKQRPDHPNSHRLLAWALLRLGEHRRAFAALEAGLSRRYPSGRFAGVHRVLREELGLIGAAWIARDKTVVDDVRSRLRAVGAKLPTQPSLRFVLSWETDANDVDLHIHDRRGGHAYYSRRGLPSGGRLYADVTTGYGPECFTIEGRPAAFPYRLRAHYYRRGPMGYGMGTLQVIQHDGRGGLEFSHRPFVVMNDGAYVELGKISRPL